MDYLSSNWIKTKVSVNFTHISQAVGLLVGTFAWFLLSVLAGSPVAGEGLGDLLWFGPRWSNRPGVLCACFQEALLWSYVGSFGWLCQSWPVEAPKVGPPIDENLALRGKIWPLRGRQGCGRLAVTPLQVVLSSWQFVWRFRRASTSKIWWCFGGGLPQLCAGRLESWTSDRQKFGHFWRTSALWGSGFSSFFKVQIDPSEVDTVFLLAVWSKMLSKYSQNAGKVPKLKVTGTNKCNEMYHSTLECDPMVLSYIHGT